MGMFRIDHCVDLHLTNTLRIKKIKSLLYSRYYAEVCNERRLSAWANSSEKMSQRCQTVGDTVSDLTGPKIEPRPPTPIATCLVQFQNKTKLSFYDNCPIPKMSGKDNIAKNYGVKQQTYQ